MIVSGRYEPVPTIATLFIVYPFSAKHISLNANIEQKRTRYVKGNVDEARRLTSRQACRLSSLQAGKLAGWKAGRRREPQYKTRCKMGEGD